MVEKTMNNSHPHFGGMFCNLTAQPLYISEQKQLV